MDVFEAVQTVLAVRAYRDTPLDETIVQQILEAGHVTGSSMNKQPWHFIAVQDRAMLTQLGALARSGPYIAQVPLAVVVVIDKTEYAVSDASRAIQSMILTAWAQGVGSNWVGFHGFDQAKALLAVPDDLDILAILPFGYPVEKLGEGKKKRKAFTDVVSREKFGTPYEA